MHRNCHLLILAIIVTFGRAQQFNCPSEQVSFEMLTGYVYTAPQDILDSQPGTLMLTDCIDTCRANSSCKSINYETGLCVLFSSNADDDEGIFCGFDLIEIKKSSDGRPIFFDCSIFQFGFRSDNRWNKNSSPENSASRVVFNQKRLKESKISSQLLSKAWKKKERRKLWEEKREN